MKKILVLILSCLAITALHSQNTTMTSTTTTTTVGQDKYTVSGGLLGAVNLSEFRIKDNPTNADYDMETGWGAGLWLNLPISKGFSIEPQVQYNSLRYDAGNTTSSLLLNKGKIRYITVPLLLKFHPAKVLAIAVGPQVDFVTKVTDDNTDIDREEDFNKTSFSLFGGLELFPHGRVTVFGRYIMGISNMDDRGSEVNGTEYRNQVVQAGLKLRLFGGKKESTYRATTTVILDRDGDGVPDDADKCPDQAGISKYDGCPIPDSDNDGINDEEDKCPNQAGIAKYNGCPIPDTDGDGINDELDKCPTQAGTAERNGCPATDRDNDGINDDEDRCPDIAGTAANKGCPDVPANVSKTLSASAQKVKFGTGTNNVKITTASNASLDQIVTVMNDNPGLRVRVEGHTSNVGDDNTNMKLSEDRAIAVKDYLVSKGISADRITTQGFGETMPIADNNTTAGRAKNTRVEVKVDY